MAQDLSFFERYRNELSKQYTDQAPNTPFSHLNETDFYRLSFDNRKSAELQYHLLNKLVQVEDLPPAYKTCAEHYIEAGARFLLHDAEIAQNTAEAKPYREKIEAFEKKRISPIVIQSPTPSDSSAQNISEWQKAVDKLHQDLNDLVASRFHVSKLITLISYLNLYRLLTLFSRLSVKFFWLLASEQHWIDAQDKLWDIPIQRSALDIPAATLNLLSVGVFAARLCAHFLMIDKHARSERLGEKDIPWQERAWREFMTRLPNIMNDLMWVIINLLTNYAWIWGISDPVANTLTAIALAWDCTWLVIHWYREESDWKQLKQDIESQYCTLPTTSDHGLATWELKMLKDLIFETRVKYAFMILAGLSITTSYLLFLASISTAVSVVCLSVCVVGFAMYGSADEFAGWMRAYFGTLKIKDEQAQMRTKFFNTFTQTLLPPFIMMGLFSFGWQVAALGAIAAFAYSYAPKKLDCCTLPPAENAEQRSLVAAL